MRRLLLTGPVHQRDLWLKAVRMADWEPLDWPLLEVLSLSPPALRRLCSPLLEGGVDWLCITSSSALQALGPLVLEQPMLRSLPLAIVGENSARRAGELGLHCALPPAENATSLAATLLQHLGESGPETRILWPRGPTSDELARKLRAAGATVYDPIVYHTVAVEHPAAPPPFEALFLASPSALQLWIADHPHLPVALAIAIGPTTLRALEGHAPVPFCQLIHLEAPTPDSLTHILSSYPATAFRPPPQ